MTTECIIVDIDGTLSNSHHRLHFLQSNPANWKGFYEAMGEDKPHQYVVDLVKTLGNQFDVILASGRPADYVDLTVNWLKKYGIRHDHLMMRKSKDFRPDTIIKKEFLDKIRAEHHIPKFAIDDRPEVVRMWRDNGVPCFQVEDKDWYAPAKPNTDLLEWLTWMQKQHHEPMFKKVADEITALRRKLDKAILPIDEL